VSGHRRSPDVKGRAHPGFNMFRASLSTFYLSRTYTFALDKHTGFRLSYLVLLCS